MDFTNISKVLGTKLYSYEGKDYEVLRMVKMKDPNTGVWLDAFEYKALYDNLFWMGNYVREAQDFMRKFNPTHTALVDPYTK